MRIDESRIRQIIREEAGHLLTEAEDFDGDTGMPATPNGVAIKLRGILSAVDKGRLSEADRKLLGFIMKVIDPGNLKAAGFLQLVLAEINNEGVSAELRRGRAEADANLSRRIGAERRADQARQGIRSFDPDTGKPIYNESRLLRLHEGSSPAGVFDRIKGIREETEWALAEARDYEDEQIRGVTITVGDKRKDGYYPWKKKVAGKPVKTGKAKSEAAAWQAAIDA